MSELQLELVEALRKRGIRVETEFDDGFKSIDIFLPDVNIAIEVDGSQHVTNPKQIISDFSREHYSDQKNVHTMHIDNKVVGKIFEEIADALAKIVEEQKPIQQLRGDIENLKK